MPVPKGTRVGGRKKGTPNKFTSDVRAMISEALHKVGGVKYLQEQADKNPNGFMALVGKTLPKEVNLNTAGSLAITMYLSTEKCPASPTDT